MAKEQEFFTSRLTRDRGELGEIRNNASSSFAIWNSGLSVVRQLVCGWANQIGSSFGKIGIGIASSWFDDKTVKMAFCEQRASGLIHLAVNLQH